MTDDQGWDALFEDGPELPWRVRGGWLEGLGFNRGAPDDVQIRLLDHGVDAFLSRELSDAVFEATAARPERGIRARLVDTWRPALTTEQWTALLLREPEDRLRALFVERAAVWDVPLPAEAHERLAGDPAPSVRAEAAALPGMPPPLLTALAADPEAVVRKAACGAAWEHLPAAERERPLTDDDLGVRKAALLRHHRDHPMPRAVYETLDPRLPVETCRLDRELAEELVRHEDPDLRRALARNPALDADLVMALAADPDRRVRFQASVHPGLGEERRAAAIPADFDAEGLRYDVPWVRERHGDPDEMRRLAGSVHPVIRSSVARAERLPPDVVERLARDEDRVVRLFLAESCDDAPADMLLEVWHWWTGSFSKPGRPRTHPNFPRTGLLRYAEDPNPRLRQLALDDPESSAELVERFALDQDGEVRRRAAEDARLSPESAVRLLEDTDDGVRSRATAHPSLPVPVLVRLLLREKVRPWEGAARNPAIPGPVMHRMIDLGAAGP
ncbi:PE-PGRS family protein [Streptomyces sp. NPDC048629]|uniref:PE-PGRS family protein n=1 Tax=Streptomyces sp. NPDC048629 TaxID=3154824 RepID=UPI0034407C75